jgi:adenylate cyclase, class 2
VIEAELKARLRAPGAVRDQLLRRADEETSIYYDTYYYWPGRQFYEEGRELRLRVVETGRIRRAVLTYKEPPVDSASGSKPEHETAVADASVINAILHALGAEILIAFEKHCVNYRFTAEGRDMLATIVTVPELDGVFLELETMAEGADLQRALRDVRKVLSELGIADDELTMELYSDAVARART